MLLWYSVLFEVDCVAETEDSLRRLVPRRWVGSQRNWVPSRSVSSCLQTEIFFNNKSNITSRSTRKCCTESTRWSCYWTRVGSCWGAPVVSATTLATCSATSTRSTSSGRSCAETLWTVRPGCRPAWYVSIVQYNALTHHMICPSTTNILSLHKQLNSSISL